jgi:recombination protein RecA
VPKKITKKKKEKQAFLSTGSTLLDLAISGGVSKYGGIPPGIIVEIFGPSSSGKTAILSEASAYAQARKGEIQFLDPEGRLIKEYSRIYGVSLNKDNYHRPDTVAEVFERIRSWKPSEKGFNIIATDSLAALSTDLEMDGGDKMGMRRAKEFSEGLRKTCRMIVNNGWIILCSNQERESQGGSLVTPGGKGIPYYASLRIRIYPQYRNGKIEKKKKIRGKEHTKIIGIRSECKIMKSSIDDPLRTAPINVIFGYGIDDIRANLQWYKEAMGSKKYIAADNESATMDKSIKYIEKNRLQIELKNMVVDLWHEIEDSFDVKREKKKR